MMTEEQIEALERALALQVANEPAADAEYQATRAYWITRGRAEDAGVPSAQAHELGRQAMAMVLANSTDSVEFGEGDDRYEQSTH